MKKLFLTIIALFLFAMNANATELQPLRIAQFGKEKFLLYLPLYIADEEGYFTQNGLKPEYIFAGNDDQIFATVISGDADVGVGDPVFTALAVEKGLQAKTVALMLTNLGLSGYTNKKDVPSIKTADDLKGLRVGSFPAPSTTFTLLNELKNKHDVLQDMQIVEGPIGTQLAMLEAKQLDIAVDLEPAVSIAESKGYRVVFLMTPFIKPQAVTGMMVTQKMIETNPQLVEKVVHSLQQALNAMHTDHAVAYRTAAKLFPQLSKNVIHNAVDRMLKNAMYPQSVIVKNELWQRTLQTRLDSGELKKPQTLDKAVDNQFAEKAWRMTHGK